MKRDSVTLKYQIENAFAMVMDHHGIITFLAVKTNNPVLPSVDFNFHSFSMLIKFFYFSYKRKKNSKIKNLIV